MPEGTRRGLLETYDMAGRKHLPKPQLSEVMSEEELRKKVTETLRMSKALEVIWKQPVTGVSAPVGAGAYGRNNQES